MTANPHLRIFKAMFGNWHIWGLLWLAALCSPGPLFAEPLLADLELEEGVWELAVVSLHNYNASPLQEEYGTFLVRNTHALRQMKQSWQGHPFFEDNCDYHYALKFYQNRKLRKTLLLNLNCQYITEGMFSYTFDPQLLFRFRAYFERVPWSNINYSDIRKLRTAIQRLENQQQFYFYHDVKPYQYDGCFVLKTTGHKPDADRDSLVRVLADYIAWHAESRDFHIVPHLLYLDDRDRLAIRYEVYCNEDLARKYLGREQRNVVAWWRSHLEWIDQENKTLTLTVVGISQKRYNQVMGYTSP
ncbi:MAG: hypothetical protein KF690_05815 [Bacteroidetes bacterium]|nr:hypothetical protein [Bacteroidota bacterium]